MKQAVARLQSIPVSGLANEVQVGYVTLSEADNRSVNDISLASNDHDNARDIKLLGDGRP